MTIQVLLADDQELIRRGFRMILEEQADISVIGEAADGDEAVRLTGDLHPDVVLMDVRMPGTDGIDATRRIVAEHPGTQEPSGPDPQQAGVA
jgi:YesN/AraC family two-component response regulator